MDSDSRDSGRSDRLPNLIWDRDKEVLTLGDEKFTVTNRVRNELDKSRKLHNPKEVVRAITNGQYGSPVMPRKFPKGIWNITEIEYTKARDFAPIKIKTDAFQKVQVWALDEAGGYDHALTAYVDDAGYYLHWSEFSSTTIGCGRVGTDSDKEIRRLAELIEPALKRGEKVKLEVV